MVRVAVYTIAKNEESFVKRWYQSAKDADFLFILDTGSTDNTVRVAKKLGINVEVQTFDPWRFDTARNEALSFIPENIDYCIALDMDEVLVDGWKEKLEKAAIDKTNRPRYQYTWSWNEDGSPGLVYGGDKIHSRHGFVWKHPVHEVLVCKDVETQGWYDLEIHHYPDRSKSRSQYMPLLKLAVEEDPEDDRNTFYYARELFFKSDMENAAKEFKRHLSLPKAVWKPERSASMRYLSKIEDTESWLLRSAAESPDRREPWFELSMYYYFRQDWISCLSHAERTLSIKDKPLEYLCEEDSWGYKPYDLAAIASYSLGFYKKARKYGEIALSINPKDERLFSNLEWYNKKGD